MIRRTFFQLFSGLFVPRPALLAAIASNPTLPQCGATAPPAAEIYQPEWLQEWKRIPRLEIFPEDLPDYDDPHQLALAADILPRIHNGTPYTFRYLGGSDPGVV